MRRRIDGRLVLLALVLLVALAAFVAYLLGTRETGGDLEEARWMEESEGSEAPRRSVGESAAAPPGGDERTLDIVGDGGSESPRLVVHVVRTDGSRVAGARVALRGRFDESSALTDADGTVDLAFHEGAVLVTEPPDALADIRTVDGPGEVEVLIDATPLTSFQVLVDGGPPSTPLRLGLRVERRARTVETRRLEARLGDDRSRRIVLTDASGRFTWRWRESDELSISLPPGYWPEDGGNVIHLATRDPDSADPMVLRAVAARAVRGRCQLEGTGEPALGARVRIASSGSGHVVAVDERGEFEAALPPAGRDDVKVTARAQGTAITRDISTPTAGLYDVGTFVFPRGADRVVRVMDEGGAPIPGALLSVDGESRVSVTGSDGRATVEGVSPDELHVFVCAPGYTSQAIATHRLDGEAMVFLQPGTRIAIRDEHRDLPSATPVLNVEADHGLRDVLQDAPAAWLRMNGIRESDARRQMSSEFTLRPDGGPIIIHDVPVGTEMKVRSVPLLGWPTGTSHVVIDSTAIQEIVLLRERARTLRVRVIDEGRRPVPGAVVHLTPHGWGFGPGFPVDGRGDLEMEGLVVPAVGVDVLAPGYAWAERGEVALDDAVTEVEVAMIRGVSGTLLVVDPEGRPVDADVRLVAPRHRGPSRELRRVGAGRFELLDLPAGPIRIAVTVGTELVVVERYLTEAARLVVEAPLTGVLVVEDFGPSASEQPNWIAVARDGVVIHCALGVRRTEVHIAPGDYGVLKRSKSVTRGQTLEGPFEPVTIRAHQTARVVFE